MMYDGIGVLKDDARAARAFSEGYEAGSPVGCLNLSIAYAEGRGVPKDSAQSYSYAERACAGGSLVGCVRVATAKLG
jgi:uncharacterized protein